MELGPRSAPEASAPQHDHVSLSGKVYPSGQYGRAQNDMSERLTSLLDGGSSLAS